MPQERAVLAMDELKQYICDELMLNREDKRVDPSSWSANSPCGSLPALPIRAPGYQIVPAVLMK